MIYYSANSVTTVNTAIIMTIHYPLLPQSPTCSLTLKPLPDTADTALNGLHKERCVVALMDVWSQQRMFKEGGVALLCLRWQNCWGDDTLLIDCRSARSAVSVCVPTPRPCCIDYWFVALCSLWVAGMVLGEPIRVGVEVAGGGG